MGSSFHTQRAPLRTMRTCSVAVWVTRESVAPAAGRAASAAVAAHLPATSSLPCARIHRLPCRTQPPPNPVDSYPAAQLHPRLSRTHGARHLVLRLTQCTSPRTAPLATSTLSPPTAPPPSAPAPKADVKLWWFQKQTLTWLHVQRARLGREADTAASGRKRGSGASTTVAAAAAAEPQAAPAHTRPHRPRSS